MNPGLIISRRLHFTKPWGKYLNPCTPLHMDYSHQVVALPCHPYKKTYKDMKNYIYYQTKVGLIIKMQTTETVLKILLNS